MGITLGKGCVCDVRMLLQSSGRPTQLSLGSLSLVKDLTMKRSLVISYTNWSGASVIPLMSPWQDETSQHSGIEMRGVQADPLWFLPMGLPHGPCRCVGTLGSWYLSCLSSSEAFWLINMLLIILLLIKKLQLENVKAKVVIAAHGFGRVWQWHWSCDWP